MSTAPAMPLSQPGTTAQVDVAGVKRSQRRMARWAGLLYLIVGIFGGFAIGYANPSVYVPGDAATTAGNVPANSGLVRVGVMADLLQATAFVFLAMVLYVLLMDVNRNAARAMVIFVAIATTMMCLNEVFQFAALLVAGDGSYVAAFGARRIGSLVMLLMDMFHYGFLMAQIFFGLWLVPLGYLVYRSGMFPKALGVVLIVGGVSYLVDMLVAFLFLIWASRSMGSWRSLPRSPRSGWCCTCYGWG